MDSTSRDGKERRRVLLSFALLLSSLSGCLLTFERDWRAARNRHVPADNLAGLWEGTWESDHNGHRGTLKAIITPCGNGQYRAQYKGTFALIIPFAYTTSHSATSDSGVVHFSGQENLGPLFGGNYSINGWANGETFVASFRADVDHGTFRMHRISSCDCCSECCPTGCAIQGDCTACDTGCHTEPVNEIEPRYSYDDSFDESESVIR